jgi:hypothetical protein
MDSSQVEIKKSKIKSLALVGFLVLVIGVLGFRSLEYNQNVNDVEAELVSTRDDLREAERVVDSQNGTIENLSTQVNTLRSRVSILEEQRRNIVRADFRRISQDTIIFSLSNYGREDVENIRVSCIVTQGQSDETSTFETTIPRAEQESMQVTDIELESDTGLNRMAESSSCRVQSCLSECTPSSDIL